MISKRACFEWIRCQFQLWMQLPPTTLYLLGTAGTIAGLAAVFELLSLAILPFFIRELQRNDSIGRLILVLGFPLLISSLTLRLVDIRCRYSLTARLQIIIAERLLHCQLLKRFQEAASHGETAFLSALTQDLVNLGSIFTYQLTLIANLLLVLVVVVGLLVYSSTISALVLLIALLYYSVSTLLTARWVHSYGAKALAAQHSLLGELRQLFGLSFLLLPLFGSSHLSRRFTSFNKQIYRSQSNANALISVPKVLIDNIVLAALLFVSLWIARAANAESLGDRLSLVLFFLLAFNRLLPGLQQIYLSISVIGQNLPSLNRILCCLQQQQPQLDRLIAQIDEVQDGHQLLPDESFRISICNLQPLPTVAPVCTVSANGLSEPGLTCELSSGLFYWLKGPSGIGKSTLMQILAGHAMCESGFIFVNSRIVNPYLDPAWISRVSYVPQRGFVFPLSIRDNITLQPFTGSHEYNEKRLLSILDIVQLNDHDPESVLPDFDSGLSGGQQQRLILARALYQNPRLLILDEVFTGLDAPTRKRLLAALNEYVKAAKVCVLVISHDPLPIDFEAVITLAGLR